MARMTDTANLPSNGLLYPLTTVTLQNMTVSETKLILGSNFENAVNQILKNCCTEQDIDFDNLIAADKTYLLIRLRALTHGAEYPIELTCPNCGKKHQFIVRLDELDVDELEPEFAKGINLVLPQNKAKVSIGLPLSKKVNEYRRLAKRKSDKYKLNDDQTMYVFNIMMMINTVDGSEMDSEELYTWVSELSANDAAYLQYHYDKIKVGYDLSMVAECPYCQEDQEFTMPMTGEFFRPKFND